MLLKLTHYRKQKVHTLFDKGSQKTVSNRTN